MRTLELHKPLSIRSFSFLKNPHRIALSVLVCSALACTAAHAAGVYGGPYYYGAWASATAASTTNTSGPSEQSPGGPVPNGSLQATATASGGNGDGSIDAAGYAHVGYLGGTATATGCTGGLFQQPCIGGGNYTEFYDQFHLEGAPAGTPISVQFTLTTTGTIDGFGNYGYQARFSDGFYTVENSGGSGGVPQAFNSLGISQSHSWTRTYYVGNENALTGWMNMSVGEDNCPGGSQNCGVVNAITLDLGHTSLASAKILTPGFDIQMISASGYDYLNPVPLPASAWLLGAGLLGLAGGARRARFN